MFSLRRTDEDFNKLFDRQNNNTSSDLDEITDSIEPDILDKELKKDFTYPTQDNDDFQSDI